MAITITNKVKYIEISSNNQEDDGLGRISNMRLRKELCQDFLTKDNSPICQIVMATGGVWSIDFNKVTSPAVTDAVDLQNKLEAMADVP